MSNQTTREQLNAAIKEDNKAKAELLKIASKCLGLDSLETQNNDSEDFKEFAIWQIQDALNAAFQAGKKAVK